MAELAPRAYPQHSKVGHDRALVRDLKIMVRFVGIYCDNRHKEATRITVRTKPLGVPDAVAGAVELCSECAKLLRHALVKRLHCPMDPKPACKHCPNHCYHPKYREAIREVMKYSGMRMVVTGRLDYLFHLLF